MPLPGTDFSSGRAWLQDVRKPIRWPAKLPKAKLVFTSPPYLEVMLYGKLNWVRHWLIGANPRDVDRQLFASASLSRYVEFMGGAIRRVRAVLSDELDRCL